MTSNIRNFAIIAHVDHGKSTLADRLMEKTGTIKAGSHEEQMLDRNPISRERGITIKLAPVRMPYVAPDGNEYILNLIDTPGHVDFSYEVDRTLACVEGVVLLVDATQGIQAQTIANTYKALEKNLTIIPVINKIDLPSAQVEKTTAAIVTFLGVPEEDIIGVSAKTGENVQAVLDAIITRISAPQIDENDTTPLQALIFDSYFDPHQGVIAFVRVVAGSAQKGIKAVLNASDIKFESTQVGIFTPDLYAKPKITAGEIGYIVTSLKDIHAVRVGDTIIDEKRVSQALSGYKKVKPMVYASMFPTDSGDYENLKRALDKIYLNDSSLEFSPIYSKALGPGFRVGFLGLLHADVIRERLEREYNLSLILTPPQVDYQMQGDVYLEPIVKIFILTPQDYAGAVMQLCEDYRGQFITMDNAAQLTLTYELPLSEMISDFFDSLKSITSGYASFDWEFMRYQEVTADKLTIMINDDEIAEFSDIVVADRSVEKAREITTRLKELIPRQQFEIKIQAKYKGRFIASERISAYRKDVLVKGSKVVGGGDVGRKRKLLEKQKEGKKKMKMIGRVEVPKEAFQKLFRKQ
ncbi:MAG: elongation factor 4 [Weeksellaceae bacterium]